MTERANYFTSWARISTNSPSVSISATFWMSKYRPFHRIPIAAVGILDGEYGIVNVTHDLFTSRPDRSSSSPLTSLTEAKTNCRKTGQSGIDLNETSISPAGPRVVGRE